MVHGAWFMVHGYFFFNFSFNVFTIDVRIFRILSISLFSELNCSSLR